MPRAEARGCLLAEESSIAKRRFKCQWKDIEEKIERAEVNVASKKSEEYDAIVKVSYRERESFSWHARLQVGYKVALTVGDAKLSADMFPVPVDCSQ